MLVIKNNIKIKNKFAQGFTLIELLVVMSIIGILGSVMYGPFQTARNRARDTQTVGDMRVLQNYLALYADDNKGQYPKCLDVLSGYGALPSRANVNNPIDPTCAASAPNQNLRLYNYTYYEHQSQVVGYHLFSHLNDKNDALRSDADCYSMGLSVTNCSQGTVIGGTTDINATYVADPDDKGDSTKCKDLALCLLDYRQ